MNIFIPYLRYFMNMVEFIFLILNIIYVCVFLCPNLLVLIVMGTIVTNFSSLRSHKTHELMD
jgi:hypothetical protein